MNPQFLHILINHVPVIGALWTLLVIGGALLRPEPALVRVALALSVLLALAGGAAFLTGEPAEEAVEHLPGVVETAIGPHEDAAKVALGGAIACGIAGAFGFWLLRRRPGRAPLFPALAAVLVTAVLMGITAHRGGKIHRPEFQHGVSSIGEEGGAEPGEGRVYQPPAENFPGIIPSTDVVECAHRTSRGGGPRPFFTGEDDEHVHS